MKFTASSPTNPKPRASCVLKCNCRDLALSLPDMRLSFLLLFLFALNVPAATPLVNPGDQWRFLKGTIAPAASWTTASDAELAPEWLSGPGGFGYGDTAIVGQNTL